MAQVDHFLKIDGVEGDSLDHKHKNEIEVLSFTWSEKRLTGSGQGGGGSAGKVDPQDFQFVKRMDKSSPVLMSACATGQHFKNAVLVARKAGGSQQEYLRITLEDVQISGYQVGSSAEYGLLPIDQVSMTFARLELSYCEQKPDGTLGAEVKRGFDFVTNQPV